MAPDFSDLLDYLVSGIASKQTQAETGYYAFTNRETEENEYEGQ